MPETQWVITAIGLFAAMLGFCLIAIIRYDAAPRGRWALAGLLAATFGSATLAFVLLITPRI